MLHQQRNIVNAFPQGRQDNGNDIQTVIQIITESAVLDHILQMTVGSSDNSHIHMDRFLAAYAVKFLLLQYPQKFDLHFLVHFANFIEEYRAVVSQFKLAQLALYRTREGAFFMTEQFRFQQSAGNRAAVHADKRPPPPFTGIMNPLGDNFLAGAAFAANQHGRRGLCCLGGQCQHVDDLAAFADVIGKGVGRLFRAQKFLFQIFRLGGYLRKPCHKVLEFRNILDNRDYAGNFAIDKDGIDIGHDGCTVLLAADAANTRHTGTQHRTAVAVGRGLKDILPHDHLGSLMDNTQIGGIDIGDFARPVHHADAVLHRFQNHLQAFLHQGIFMEQLIHFMDFSRLTHLEIAFQKAHHFVDRLPACITFGRNKDRIPLADFERHQLHQTAHLKALTALTAQKQGGCIFLTEFPRPLDNHRRNAGMYAAVVVYHGLLFIHHLTGSPFCLP